MDPKQLEELEALGPPAAKFLKTVFNDLESTIENPLVRMNAAVQLAQTWVQTAILSISRPDADPDDKWKK